MVRNMSDVSIPSRDDEGQIFREIVGHFDAPSYIRRARAVEESFRELVQQGRRQRAELLEFVRLQLATLQAQAGSWDRCDSIMSREVRQILERWFEEMRPT